MDISKPIPTHSSINLTQLEDARAAAEAKLVRKLDLRLLPYLCLMYMLSFLDRVNIGHAKLYGIDKDLHLTPTQFAWSLSIFFIGYVLFEVPSNLMLKRTSPSIWMARIMVTWGIITMAMALVKNAPGLLVTRFLLGIAEAGLVPGIVFYLGMWYPRGEQAVRIAFFFSATSLAGAFGGLVAYSINGITGTLGLAGWQWIFILEGLPTVLIGVATYWVLPDSPTKVSWLNEDERSLLIHRLERSHVELDSVPFDRSQFINTLKTFRLYLHMLFYLSYCTPFYTLSLLMPTIINGLGYQPVPSMLLSVPPYVMAFLFTMVIGKISDWTMNRAYAIVAAATTSLVGFIVLWLATHHVVRYLSLSLAIMGATACIAPALSWSNNNFPGATASATSSAMIIASGNLGGVIGGQLYPATQAPAYALSHAINIMFLVITIVTVLLLRWVYSRANLARAAVQPDQGLEKVPFQYVL